MANPTVKKNPSFRAATDDLVKTVQAAIENKEINKEDREWLIKELNEMIWQLQSAKKSPVTATR